MPATSIFSRASSSAISGIGNSRISVVPGPVRTAASTCSAMEDSLPRCVGAHPSRRSIGLTITVLASASMADLHLRTVTRTQANNQALKDGTVVPEGFSFDFEEVPVLVQAFRRMVRTLEFDVCEMALTTYLTAKAHGVAFTAVPAFLVRGFHHSAITVDTRHGISTPKDLEGKKVGVSRGYTVTTGVWARAILAAEYGVDLSSITWVLSGDEHVASYQAPGNVESIPPGRELDEMLASGELAAVVGVEIDSPDARPLIADPSAAGFAALQE